MTTRLAEDKAMRIAFDYHLTKYPENIDLFELWNTLGKHIDDDTVVVWETFDDYSVIDMRDAIYDLYKQIIDAFGDYDNEETK